jgi:hypothetical protein
MNFDKNLEKKNREFTNLEISNQVFKEFTQQFKIMPRLVMCKSMVKSK